MSGPVYVLPKMGNVLFYSVIIKYFRIISNDTNSVDFENSLVPFHKLSQWLTYSLLEPMSVLIGVQFEGLDLMTGLAEYRNGGCNE